MEKQPIDVFEEVTKLQFPEGHFIVVGSGILAAKGIRPAYDLDMVVSKELFETCAKNETWQRMPWTRRGRPGPDWLKGPKGDITIEITLEDHSLDVQQLLTRGEIIRGVPFLSLAQLLLFKRLYGRPKDFEDIALIERWITSHE